MNSWRLRRSAVCHTVSSCGPGTRINQLTINYVGQCVASQCERSSVFLFGSGSGWTGFAPVPAQRLLQRCCDCLGEGKARVCSLWFIPFYKCTLTHTVDLVPGVYKKKYPILLMFNSCPLKTDSCLYIGMFWQRAQNAVVSAHIIQITVYF